MPSFDEINIIGATLVRDVHDSYRKGIVTRVDRSDGVVRIITDNDDLMITALRTKIVVEERYDGSYDIRPGWEPPIAFYYLYMPGVALPDDIARRLR